MHSLGVLYIKCSLQTEILTTFFPIQMSFTSFSGLNNLAETYSTILNGSVESGHPYLISGLRGKDL